METKKPESLAIYGGSFDPPHLGHLAVIEAALQKLDIDRLVVVPAYLSPFKSGHAAPGDLRLRWLEKITAFDPRIEVSDFEIMKKGPSYTIDTVEHFARNFDTIHLIIGADNLPGLPRWHRFDELNEKVRWVVAARDAIRIPPGYIRLEMDVPVSSSDLRRRLDPDMIPAPIREEVVNFYKKERD